MKSSSNKSKVVEQKETKQFDMNKPIEGEIDKGIVVEKVTKKNEEEQTIDELNEEDNNDNKELKNYTNEKEKKYDENEMMMMTKMNMKMRKTI